jgi:hypothetical protein
MRIMPAGNEAAVEPLRRKPPPKGGFADLVDAGQAEMGELAAASLCPAAATAPLTAPPPPDLGARDPGARDRQARRQAHALLGALSRLQAARLGASASDARQQLARMAQVCTDADDPELRDALRAIALRVAVELAKAA